MRLDAFLPPGAGPFPGAVLVHGGGWVSGDRRWNVEPLLTPLLEAGLACFSISYRLAEGIADFGAAVQDVEQAVRYTREHAAEFAVDPGRLALVGESAGGHLAAMAALGEACSGVKAVVSFYAPADLEQLAQASKFIPEHLRRAVRGSPFESMVLERLRQFSPARQVRGGLPPFLLIHGTADALVPFDQSRDLCRALRKAGGECDLIAVKGGVHGLRRWESAGLTGYKRLMVDWLRKRLG
ncbi:MAG TPA: alpha/beta hydrolase [Bryobacteraceae bacterium]|nr:alpha/beta hydrolase [Bryobacteraceae bacterium]